MAKGFSIPLLLIIGCLMAGVYGALHNQLSYTVSPEYFHAFKFRTFSLPPTLHSRAGASLVGLLASWWMGLVIGFPLVLGGLLVRGWQAYCKHVLAAYAVAIATTLIIGLVGLLLAIAVDFRLPSDWPLLEGVQDVAAFSRAAAMHNASYAGGLLGALSALVYLAVIRWRQARAMQLRPGPIYINHSTPTPPV